MELLAGRLSAGEHSGRVIEKVLGWNWMRLFGISETSLVPQTYEWSTSFRSSRAGFRRVRAWAVSAFDYAADADETLGIPIAVKNLYDTHDMATTDGSLAFAGFPAGSGRVPGGAATRRRRDHRGVILRAPRREETMLNRDVAAPEAPCLRLRSTSKS